MVTVKVDIFIQSYIVECEAYDAKDVIQRAENQYSQEEQPPFKFIFAGAWCKFK